MTGLLLYERGWLHGRGGLWGSRGEASVGGDSGGRVVAITSITSLVVVGGGQAGVKLVVLRHPPRVHGHLPLLGKC
jgi:hypothetical protein